MEGNIEFECILCENIFYYFPEYAKHIKAEHSPFLNVESFTTNLYADESEIYQDDFGDDFESFKTQQSTSVKNIIAEAKTDTADSTGITLFQKEKSIPIPRKYKCSQCTFSCKDHRNLIGHIKRHTGIKKNQCSECPKKFYTKCELKMHLRSHTNERPFLCCECGKAFKTSSKLGEHIKRHKNVKDKGCPICEMKFFNSQTLRRHLRTHSENRQQKCSVCSATFKRHTALANHLKLHANKLEYQCEFCAAKFNQKQGLYFHLKMKHSLENSTTKSS